MRQREGDIFVRIYQAYFLPGMSRSRLILLSPAAPRERVVEIQIVGIRTTTILPNALHVQIDQNYQRLYKNLLRKMDECAGEGQVGLFAQLHIKQTILSDLKEASISYMMTNLGTQSYYLHVDIHGIGEDRSKLDAYVAYSTWKDWLPRVERWARQPDATCADTPAPEQP